MNEVNPVNPRVRFQQSDTTTAMRAFGMHALVCIAYGGGSPGITRTDS